MHASRPAPARWQLPWLLLWLLPVAAGARSAHAQGLPGGLTVGGSLAVTSDYIYRGVSASNGNPAGQADLHAVTGNTFIGVWGSTRDDELDPYASYDVDLYLGHRFDLGNAWGVTLSGRAHYLVGGDQEINDDTAELSASLSYLDRWTVSITAIPNAVRYWVYRRLSRSPAWVADTGVQWLIGHGFFLIAGAGYYRSTGTGPGIERATGYGYGNAGIAFEYRSWRIDVGYFLADEKRARKSMPYPIANDRIAATLVWRF